MNRGQQQQQQQLAKKPIKTPIMYRTGVTNNGNANTVNLEEQEKSVCFICALEHPPLWAISECSHRVCSLCSLRMRILYNNTKCAWCKDDGKKVIIVKAKVEEDGSDHTKGFNELFTMATSKSSNNGDKIDKSTSEFFFMDSLIKEQALDILNIKCPINGCKRSKPFSSMEELKEHVTGAHDLFFCNICLAHQKVFPFEYRTYTKVELSRHNRIDSDKFKGSSGGARSGNRGGGNENGNSHPPCSICNTLFYSEDELGEHCRDQHENCFICQRQTRKANWFKDYKELEGHFRKEHWLCEEPLCLELKFVVFTDELEYKAHVAEMHLATTKMQRSQQKQLRRLDGSLFLSPTFDNSNNNSSGSRNRHGQIPSSSPSSSSTNRTLPTRNRTNFDSTLAGSSSPVTPASTAPIQPAEPISKTIAKNLIFGDSIGDLAQKLQSLNLYEQRNIELCDRLGKDYHLTTNQIGSFKNNCRLYHRGEQTADQLVLKLDSLLKAEGLEAIETLLCDLELDGMKKMKLSTAIKAYLRKLREFPSLSTDFPLANDAPGPSYVQQRRLNKTGLVGADNDKSNNVMRIKTTTFNPHNRNVNLAVDPAKNPLALLGAIKSTGVSIKSLNPAASSSSKPIKKVMSKPLFSQTVAPSPALVGISKSVKDQDMAPQSLDEHQFPSLSTPIERMEQSIYELPLPSSSSATNIFARNINFNQPESFVIGDDDQSKEFEERKKENFCDDKVSEALAKNKKKSKGTLLLRYG